MATNWEDIVADIYAITNRPDLVTETAIALRQAIRFAHQSGRYIQDLVAVLVVAPVAEVQSVDLRYIIPAAVGNPPIPVRQLAKVEVTGSDGGVLPVRFDPVTIDDMLDLDGYFRQNVYWGVGNMLNIRAANPSEFYKLTVFVWPPILPAGQMYSWMFDEFRDLLSTFAAATVCGMTGESEIKARMDVLAAAELSRLKSTSLEIIGR